MNTQSALHERLLKLFPVKYIKDRFDISGGDQKSAIAEIIQGFTLSSIKKVCFEEMDRTKQHIKIFNLQGRFRPGTFLAAEFPYEVVSTEIKGRNFIIHASPTVEYSVLLLYPNEEISVKFFQPLKVTVTPSKVIIQITILEKKIDSYFPDRKVVELSKSNKEDEVIESIVNYFFGEGCPLSICDINKGVKALLDLGVIDCTSVKFKKNRSTSTENMDENHTVKNSYPDVYAQMMAAPLKKTAVKYLSTDGDLLKHFATDPSGGEITIPLYPEDEKQIGNVINKILQNN